MFRLLTHPAAVSQSMSRWRSIVGDFDEIFAYSFLGVVFLRNSSNGQCAVLFPVNPEVVPVEIYSISSFINTFLAHPEARRTLLNEPKIVEIETRLGALDHDDIFIPVPLPFLGGDCSVGSYKKGNFYTYMDLVGGLQDIESS